MKSALVIFLFLFLNTPVFPQWEAGALYNNRISSGGNGFGINIVRKLPFQFPKFGASSRLNINYFSDESSNGINNLYFTSDYNFSLLFNLFYKYLQPYSGFGVGLSYFTAEQRTPDNPILQTVSEKHISTLNALAGIRFTFHETIYPFVEVKFMRYLSGFNAVGDDLNRNRFHYSAGISFRIITIKQ
jgi:hypothetical protein